MQDVHASLANEDKLDAIIYKQRALMYPHGQDIAAVEFMYRAQRHAGDDQVEY